MVYFDLAQMAMSNLWRTKLRSSLTILGVVIGIGALSSMISFGVGMQKNLTDAFKKNLHPSPLPSTLWYTQPRRVASLVLK